MRILMRKMKRLIGKEMTPRCVIVRFDNEWNLYLIWWVNDCQLNIFSHSTFWTSECNLSSSFFVNLSHIFYALEVNWCVCVSPCFAMKKKNTGHANIFYSKDKWSKLFSLFLQKEEDRIKERNFERKWTMSTEEIHFTDQSITKPVCYSIDWSSLNSSSHLSA